MNQVRESPEAFWRTRNWSPRRAPGSLWSPGGRDSTADEVSLEGFLCRFVVTWWSLYVKPDEMAREAMKRLRSYKTSPLRLHRLSCSFTRARHETAWGARGPEFKSRRPDQL